MLPRREDLLAGSFLVRVPVRLDSMVYIGMKGYLILVSGTMHGEVQDGPITIALCPSVMVGMSCLLIQWKETYVWVRMHHLELELQSSRGDLFSWDQPSLRRL